MRNISYGHRMQLRAILVLVGSYDIRNNSGNDMAGLTLVVREEIIQTVVADPLSQTVFELDACMAAIAKRHVG